MKKRTNPSYASHPRRGGTKGASRWLLCIAASLALLRPAPSLAQDVYEPDDHKEWAQPIGMLETQRHDFHTAQDQDWMSFVAVAGLSYAIEATHIDAGNNTWIQLFAPDGTTCLLADETLPSTPDAAISFTVDPLDPFMPLDTGVYFVRAFHTNCGVTECGNPNPSCVIPADTDYDIRIRPTDGGLGQVFGRVLYQASPVDGVTVAVTDSDRTQNVQTQGGGAFGVVVKQGAYSVSASPPGYNPFNQSGSCTDFACNVTVDLTKQTCARLGSLDDLGPTGLAANLAITFTPFLAAAVGRIRRAGRRTSRSRPTR